MAHEMGMLDKKKYLPPVAVHIMLNPSKTFHFDNSVWLRGKSRGIFTFCSFYGIPLMRRGSDTSDVFLLLNTIGVAPMAQLLNLTLGCSTDVCVCCV